MNTLEAFDTAIAIERKLSKMYHKFSTLYKDNTEAHNFWANVADHEKSHSETLTLSKGYLLGKRPDLQNKNIPLVGRSDTVKLESLLAMIKDCERRIKKERLSLQEALDMLLKIENSELNHMYHRLIHLSGLKLPRKPDNDYRNMDEHIRVIKSFMDKYYKGEVPVMSEPAELQRTTPGRKRGKVVEIITEMSYGFIEGVDGQIYMFLSGDMTQENLPKGNFEDTEVGSPVEFSVIRLPWGPRANNISFRV